MGQVQIPHMEGSIFETYEWDYGKRYDYGNFYIHAKGLVKLQGIYITIMHIVLVCHQFTH